FRKGVELAGFVVEDRPPLLAELRRGGGAGRPRRRHLRGDDESHNSCAAGGNHDQSLSVRRRAAAATRSKTGDLPFGRSGPLGCSVRLDGFSPPAHNAEPERNPGPLVPLRTESITMAAARRRIPGALTLALGVLLGWSMDHLPNSRSVVMAQARG